MKRWNQVALAMFVAAATVACAGDRTEDTAGTDQPAAVGTAGDAAEPAREADADATRAVRGDGDFVGDMIQDGRAEVMLGKLAQQKAQNARVKQFAAMMVKDHTRAGAELKSVAGNANIDLADAETEAEDHAEVRNRLAKLAGAEFDREYMKAMVDDHEKAVDEVEDKAENASSDHVKQWAAKTLPALKKHLEEARQIHESLDKRSGN